MGSSLLMGGGVHNILIKGPCNPYLVIEKAMWSLVAECQVHFVIVIEHVQFSWLLLN